MNTLERLKELNDGNEWDFNDLGFLVNALPALIAVAEAARWVKETTSHAYVLNQAAVRGALKKLNAALAKLEAMERERKERKRDIWAREIQRLDRQIARIEAEIKGGGEGC